MKLTDVIQHPEEAVRLIEVLRTRYTAQGVISDAVRGRGYRDGWTDVQFLVRNLIKVVEELAEFAEPITVINDLEYDFTGELRWWLEALNGLAEKGRVLFDADNEEWDKVQLQLAENDHSPDRVLRDELADVQVVVFNMADALDAIIGGTIPVHEYWSVVDAAVVKSLEDEKRGVRGETA